jgi:hypothetical protein
MKSGKTAQLVAKLDVKPAAITISSDIDGVYVARTPSGRTVVSGSLDAVLHVVRLWFRGVD